MINHAHDLTLDKLFEQLDLPCPLALDVPIADGGPVEPQRGFILHTNDASVDSSEAAGEGLAISYSREILELIATQQGPRKYLVALGYAGWGAGQLEYELDDSAWLTAPCDTDVLFDVPFQERLDRVAGTLGIDHQDPEGAGARGIPPVPSTFRGDWRAAAYGPDGSEIAGRLRLWMPLPDGADPRTAWPGQAVLVAGFGGVRTP